MKKTCFLIFLSVFVFSCTKTDPVPAGMNFKQEMKNLVQDISEYSKNLKENFIIIPQNGQELISIDGSNTDAVDEDYINAIDGVGREDLLFGYSDDNVASPGSEIIYMLSYLFLAKDNGVKVLVTDYCSDTSKMNFSYTENNKNGFISFAANHRDLDVIPNFPVVEYNMNSEDIWHLGACKNFLYIIDPGLFPDKASFINAIEKTDYDLIIIDLFFNTDMLNVDDINRLKIKTNGAKRLVVCYLSIGEAEDYRYYWNSAWSVGEPSWLEKENPDWKGNYIVRYWEQDWKDIIFGNNDSYLKKIIDAGFDGAYLDIIDAFEYFE